MVSLDLAGSSLQLNAGNLNSAFVHTCIKAAAMGKLMRLLKM